MPSHNTSMKNLHSGRMRRAGSKTYFLHLKMEIFHTSNDCCATDLDGYRRVARSPEFNHDVTTV